MYRTYLPTLILIVNRICKYVLNHDERLRAAMAPYPTLLAAFNTMETACGAFRVIANGLDLD